MKLHAWALALPALLLAGTAMAQPAAGILRIGSVYQDIGTLDPQFAVGSNDRIPVSWIFGALVRFKPGTTDPALIEPDLAEKWESSADKLTWTFHLRRGVQFHGGYGELTAADVVYSLRKAADAKTSAFSADFASIAAIDAVDPHTVRITFRQVVPSVLGLLTNYSGGFIVSAKAQQERGDGFKRNPIGSGPFAFKSVTATQSLELVAHAAYFRGKPKLNGISYKFMPSLASRDLAFQTGELDISEGAADQSWVTRTRQVPGTIVDVLDPAELSQLYFNVTAKPLDDIRVRQAIALAVNRPELVKWRGPDISREPRSIVPTGYLGMIPDAGLPATDLDKARKLLAEAGYPSGLTIKMIHSQNPTMLSAMQVVQAQLKRAGIDIDLQVVEHAAFHQMIRQDLSPIVFYSAARFPVADTYLTQFFHSRSTVKTPTAVTNFSHCGMADAEIDGARTATDPARQAALWAEAQRKLIAAVCAAPLIETRAAWARKTNFEYGYAPIGNMGTGPLITELSHFK